MQSLKLKTIFISAAGTSLQWYDFALFGYFASIISVRYFPQNSYFAAQIGAFVLFAVGFVLAPIGSVLFGFIGDRYGRKIALRYSILAMAIPTALIAIVPTYYQIGLLAPIILALLRLTQGFVASGEYSGSAIFLVEHANIKQRYFYGSLTSSAYSLGVIVAACFAALATIAIMPSWAWRIPFTFSLIAGVIIYMLRTQVDETPVFKQLNQQRQIKLPFFKALTHSPRSVIHVLALSWFVGHQFLLTQMSE